MLTDFGKPRVFLGMPCGYGTPDDVARTFWQKIWAADPRRTEVVDRRQHQQSSIVGGFNALWGRALDLRDQGKADHFAMQHADIEPESWWIDILLDILRRRNLAAVFTVVTIKDREYMQRPFGRWETSCGAARRADPYDWRRFNYDDLAGLPITFTNQHLSSDEYLMPNTGLWVADIRNPVWDDFVFTQDGKFTRGEDGSRVFSLMPEDWALGRWMTERSIPYAVTTAVKCRHHGPCRWPNHRNDEAGDPCPRPMT